MDAESLKLIVSVLSAVVAVVSAVVAYRTRKQTRLDLFETQRDVLVLATSENDIRLRTLELRISLLHAQLTKALNSSGEVAHPEIESTLRGLSELNSVVREFQRRDWTEDQIRRMEYTEVALLELRRRTVEEQVMSKTIQAEAQNILLDQAHADLELLKSRSEGRPTMGHDLRTRSRA